MVEIIASVFLGLGLAASAGFRVFLPLLALSIAHHFGVVPLHENWAWVGGYPAMTVFAVATILEVLAYFIPFFDNLLDAIALPAATLAGTVVVASTVMEIDPLWRWVLAIVAGGGTAGLIKGVNAKTRLAASTTTAGLGNPVISATETGLSAAFSVLSILIWPLAAVALVLLLVGLIFFYKKLRRYWKKIYRQDTDPTKYQP